MSVSQPRFELLEAPGTGFVIYRALMPIADAPDLQTRVDAVARFAEAHAARGILFDVRQVRCGASVAQIYQLAYRDSAMHGFAMEWRYAFLATAGDTSQDFLETVYTNAGYDARLFTEEAAARAWLMEGLAPAGGATKPASGGAGTAGDRQGTAPG